MLFDNIVKACPLCREEGEKVIWEDNLCRVIKVEDDAYPGYCRVIWNTHVAEMTDLPPLERQHFFAVVMAVEMALRRLMAPAKINLASLGNMVPHLHWHVIPRFRDDCHFPEPIWSAARHPVRFRPAPGMDDLAREIAAGAHAAGLTAMAAG